MTERIRIMDIPPGQAPEWVRRELGRIRASFSIYIEIGLQGRETFIF